jgi:hypothetical protein
MVQGCLIGSVLLFGLLLVVMIFLAVTRMREMTAPPAEPLPTVFISPFVAPAGFMEPDAPALRAASIYHLKFAIDG